jgi:prevent-host-death family protein
MESIGIRELKAQASEVVRRVREERAVYEVTYRGRAVARIVPVMADEEAMRAAWTRVDEVAAEIAAVAPAGLDAVEAVRDVRRDL